jgi:hypothetical protein
VCVSGSIVDVRKLLSQLDRSEKARGESEAGAAEDLKALNDLKEASDKHTSIRDKLQVRKIGCKLKNLFYLKIRSKFKIRHNLTIRHKFENYI